MAKMGYIDKIYSIDTDIKSFYTFFNEANFDEITIDRIEELKILVPFIDTRMSFMNPKDYKGARKYASLMNHIKMNPKRYGLKSKAEIYIFFMLAIDPELDALLIFEKSLKSSEIRRDLLLRFGCIDLKLIKIEKTYFERIMNEEEKNKVKTKIDKAILK